MYAGRGVEHEVGGTIALVFFGVDADRGSNGAKLECRERGYFVRGFDW